MKTNKYIVYVFLITVVLFCSERKAYAQTIVADFGEIENLQLKEKRLVMVLIGTDWCKYCNSMKQAVLKDKSLGAVLKGNFYSVFLNAEEKADIDFAGRRFKYKPTGSNTGVHELAQELGTINGQIAYPSVCFLNEKYEIVYQHPGYLNPADLGLLLTRLSSN